MQIATCIGCGCTDAHACLDHATEQPCSWLKVDYSISRGVCSCCSSHLERWDKGERSVRMVVAKVTKEGQAEPYYVEEYDMGGFPALFGTNIGDKFSVEWVEMNSDEFEALPQFEVLRLAREWWNEWLSANLNEEAGLVEKASEHQSKAKELEASLAARGYSTADLMNMVAD